MSALTDIFDADVAAIEPDMPVYFVFKGKTLLGQRTQIADNQLAADAGFVQVYDFELLVRVAILPTPAPVINDVIKIGVTDYRIDKITPSQDGVMVTYSMVDN